MTSTVIDALAKFLPVGIDYDHEMIDRRTDSVADKLQAHDNLDKENEKFAQDIAQRRSEMANEVSSREKFFVSDFLSTNTILFKVIRLFDRFIHYLSDVHVEEYSPPDSPRWMNRLFFILGACSCAVVSVALIISEKISPVTFFIGIGLGVLHGTILAEQEKPGLFLCEERLVKESVDATLVGILGIGVLFRRVLPRAATISVGYLGYTFGKHLSLLIKGSKIIEGSERVYQDKVSDCSFEQECIARVSLVASIALTIVCRVSPAFLLLGLASSCMEHACIVQSRWKTLFVVQCVTAVVGSWTARFSYITRGILHMSKIVVP